MLLTNHFIIHTQIQKENPSNKKKFIQKLLISDCPKKYIPSNSKNTQPQKETLREQYIILKHKEQLLFIHLFKNNFERQLKSLDYNNILFTKRKFQNNF